MYRLGKLDGRYSVRIDGSRYRTRIPHAPENEAAARAEAEVIVRQHRERYGAKLSTCDEIFNAYIIDAQARENPVVSPDNLIYAKKALSPHFGKLTAVDCTREQSRAYLKSARAEGRADSTMRTQMSYLRAAMRWHDPHTPAVFELPSEKQTRDRWLTTEEMRALIDGTGSTHTRLFMILALCTAARTEAILGLTWDTHIDFENEEIWLGFKVGGKGRATLPINRTLKAALSEAREIALSPYVIEFNGKPVKSVRKGLRNAYARAGISDIKQPAHIIRKTAGRILVESGVSMELVSQILGHSSIKITERIYARFSPSGMRPAMEALKL
jgi:integrase